MMRGKESWEEGSGYGVLRRAPVVDGRTFERFVHPWLFRTAE